MDQHSVIVEHVDMLPNASLHIDFNNANHVERQAFPELSDDINPIACTTESIIVMKTNHFVNNINNVDIKPPALAASYHVKLVAFTSEHRIITKNDYLFDAMQVEIDIPQSSSSQNDHILIITQDIPFNTPLANIPNEISAPSNNPVALIAEAIIRSKNEPFLNVKHIDVNESILIITEDVPFNIPLVNKLEALSSLLEHQLLMASLLSLFNNLEILFPQQHQSHFLPASSLPYAECDPFTLFKNTIPENPIENTFLANLVRNTILENPVENTILTKPVGNTVLDIPVESIVLENSQMLDVDEYKMTIIEELIANTSLPPPADNPDSSTQPANNNEHTYYWYHFDN